MQSWKKAIVFGSIGVGAVLVITRRRPLGMAFAAAGLAVLASVLALATLSCRKNEATAPVAGTTLVFTVQPSNAVVDSSIAPAIVVTIEDASGNTATTSNAIVTLAISVDPGGANLRGTAQVIAVAGIASFPYLSLDRAATGYALVASSPNLASATSASFNVASETVGLFASVNTGGNATCGVSSSGVGYCWGNNNLGQLGNGATTNSSTPTKVAGGLTFGSIAVGGLYEFSCGLSVAGAAYCWGYNDYGQLGNGNFVNSISPVVVAGNLTFTSLSVGESGHACAIAGSGTAYCWGYNGSGQLGVATMAYSSTPVPVSGGLSFAAISAGENGQTCGITPAGAAYCWGSNSNGELGNGTTIGGSAPIAVSGGLTFRSITAGFASTCGITTSGAAYCWGDNTYGELGNGSTANSKTPVAVAGGLTFSAISVGDAFACGLTTSGIAYCWGYSAQGQLGSGSAARSTTPVAVLGGLTFATISAGYGSACAVTPGGAAYCWGDNAFGELGNSATGGAAFMPILVVTPP